MLVVDCFYLYMEIENMFIRLCEVMVEINWVIDDFCVCMVLEKIWIF